MVSLTDAIAGIKSDRKQDREAGLLDLKHILRHNSNSSEIAKFRDKTIHALFEDLFRSLSKEKSAFAKASRSSLRSVSESRLGGSADALRLLVHAFLPKLRAKSLHAILEHIFQTLPDADGEYCAPLTLPYLKSLTAILNYPPHVEHLSPSDWIEAVDFCLGGIQHLTDALGDISADSNGAKSFADRSFAQSSASRNASQNRNPRSTQWKGTAPSLFSCLACLVSASNAPTLDRADSLLDRVTSYLASAASTAGALDALRVINATLRRAAFDSMDLALRSTHALVPLAKSLWSSKASELRDEILTALLILHPFIRHIASSESSDTLLFELDGLLQVLGDDYVNMEGRQRRHLSLEDLRLNVVQRLPRQSSPFQSNTLALRKSTLESEHNWALLTIISMLTSTIDCTRERTSREVFTSNTRPRKRQKHDGKLMELLRASSNASSPTKVYYLQAIAFVSNSAALEQIDLEELIEHLMATIPHANPVVSSWALLGLSGCATQPVCSAKDFRKFWLSAWFSTFRLTTSVPHCRASCHLLSVLLDQNLVDYDDVSESLDSLTQAGSLDTPVLLCDSSAALWMATITTMVARAPGPAIDRSLNAFATWLISRWTPSNFETWSYSLTSSQILSMLDLAPILLAHTDLSSDLCPPCFPRLLSLGQTAFEQERDEHLLAYLLAQNEPEPLIRKSSASQDWRKAIAALPKRARQLFDTRILDFLCSELVKVDALWVAAEESRSRSINFESFQVVLQLAIISDCLSNLSLEPASGRALTAGRASAKVIGLLATFITSPESSQNTRESALESLWAVTSNSASGATFLSRALIDALFSALKVYEKGEDMRGQEDDFDADVMELGFDSQPTNIRSGVAAARSDTSSFAGHDSFISSMMAYLAFLKDQLASIDDNMPAFPSLLADYLIDIEPWQLLNVRPFLAILEITDIRISSAEADKILVHVAQQCLEVYDFTLCEAATQACLQVMRITAQTWIGSSGSLLCETAYQIYEWLVGTLLPEHKASPATQIALSDLLFHLLAHDRDYGSGKGLPSVRTSLLTILKGGEIPVQSHVSEKVSVLFSMFVLNSHAQIMHDILQSLPNDLEWIEGIELRILTLSRLAESRATVLRSCIYRIVETVGNVPSVAKHATLCLDSISRSLNLPTSRKLFMLFKSQILYTWLDHGNVLSGFPFEIFHFNGKVALLEAARDEVVSQAFLQESADLRLQLTSALSSTPGELLSRSFSQAAACAFGADVSTTSSARSTPHTVENRLRDTLGVETFGTLLNASFPSILTDVFTRLDQEETIKKAFERRKGYENAKRVFMRLQASDDPSDYLIPSQQPCFKAQFLLDIVERLCRRTGKDSASIWTPALVSLIARRLLDEIHPSLGSLQARRVIRKLRILISVAGSACLHGYALELCLHALRPFLTDSYCAQDCTEIFKYLLENGAQSLSHCPAFVVGTCLAVNLSLRALVSSIPDATAQESYHHAAVSKVETFREWLYSWVENFDCPAESISSPKIFHSLMQAASQPMGQGSSRHQSHEGRLLLTLLVDTRSNRKALSPTLSSLCLRLLCGKGFQAAETFREDILGSDDQAAKLAAQVWESCRIPGISDEYVRWATAVLGRSFNYNAHVPAQVSAESSLRHKKDMSTAQSNILPSSAAILRTLTQMLENEDASTVSLAENTLRSILSASRESEDGLLVQQCLGPELTEALLTDDVTNSVTPTPVEDDMSLVDRFMFREGREYDIWISDAIFALVSAAPSTVVLTYLIPALEQSAWLCEQLFPYVLHSVLYSAKLAPTSVDAKISSAFRQCFEHVTASTARHTATLLDAVLYLRTKSPPGDTQKGEVTRFDRNFWLDIDFSRASAAARECKMFKTALLLTEIDQSIDSKQSRRASKGVRAVPNEFLLSIFREIDEPDSFHGVPRQPSLDSVIDRLEFEGVGVKELLIRGARVESVAKTKQPVSRDAFSEMIRSLTDLNMSNLATELATGSAVASTSSTLSDSMTKAALKLRQWDLAAVHGSDSDWGCLYSTLQSAQNATSVESIKSFVDCSLQGTYLRMSQPGRSGQAQRSSFRTLAALSDIGEMVSVRGPAEFSEMRKRLEDRQRWMVGSPIEDSSTVLLVREAFFGILSSDSGLRSLMKLDKRSAHIAEAQVNLQSSTVHREQGSLQEALSNVAYLSECQKICDGLSLDISAAVQQETAHVLWSQDELIPSIRILKDMENLDHLENQSIAVGKPALLATLGHHVSAARLEKPEEVMTKYLARAVRLLRESGEESGQDAGRVYHEFATYCHRQLTSPENVEEFKRSERFKEKRQAEIQELESILKTKLDDHAKHRAKSDRNKAKKWFDIDRAENERLRRAREQFMSQSLEAYLHALAASDENDTDVLRFLALWLEHSSNEAANEKVSKNISRVPSLKFAPLMNQLASRLQDTSEIFQATLANLVERICLEHPHHGMYHIYAGSRTTGGNDRTAISRNAAATKLSARFSSLSTTADLWSNLSKANDLYIQLATARSEAFKAGMRIPLRKTSASRAVEREVPQLQVPPITLSVAMRADCDYSAVPSVQAFKPDMSIAGGLSAPKILTAIASTGQQCKQLFKAGADDLRQDAIMEQVFEQVSALLQRQKETRQRALRIRTYKVVPLDATSGAMEFVQNTQPLNDFLRSAHARYRPRDMKWDACRGKIDEVRGRSADTRLAVYRGVAEQFGPVLRHFFFERFDEADEWFARRLAYTRSTAAVSVLGHALGLGDRHCQNILLDTATGEVVHIDLGVAFEAGRILAVPEVVPFRLTRDIVDGFGVMGVEGVFRRCCEFTLDALRADRDAVMTLLNVLRYDPLYSWSMSPLRARRLQREQDREGEGAAAAGTLNPTDGPGSGDDNSDNESGEADRALSVVERKLAPGLSVMATVNELIQQATDERNLAVLFCGWAAFA